MPNGSADPRSSSRRIADDLREAIDSGQIPPGGRLPSTRELVDRYKVAAETVRQVIQHLKAVGVVETIQGSGTYVRQYQPLDWWPATFEHAAHRGDVPGSEYDAWAATVVAAGRTPSQVVKVDRVKAPAAVSKRLDIPADELVAVRYRVRYVDAVPWQTADSYYPLWVAEGTPILEAESDVTIPGGLMAATGHAQEWFDDVLELRMPTPMDLQRLAMAATGTAVGEYIRTGYDSNERPVRVNIAVLPGDRNRIRWHVRGR